MNYAAAGEVIGMSENERRIGQLKYLYGIVALRDSMYDETDKVMELTFLYAERYKQSVRYDGVLYYDKMLMEKGLYIGMAEELPLIALLESRFSGALDRFYSSRRRRNEDELKELSANGKKLFVNYGKTDDYIVVARKVTVEDVGA